MSKVNHPKEGTKVGMPAQGRLAGRIFWGAVALIPILAWAAALLFIVGGRSDQPSTGDALLDKYVSQAAHHPRRFYYTQLNPEVLATWEDDCWSDPQYWVLRSMFDDRWDPYQDPGEPQPALDYLNEARRRGVADGTVLRRLLEMKDIQWRIAIEHTVDYNPTSRSSRSTPPAEIIENWEGYWPPMRQAINERFGTEFNELMAELQDTAGDTSMAWYRSAINAAQAGDCARAIEFVKKGNRAPVNSNLAPEFFDLVLEHSSRGGWFADPAIRGDLFNTWDSHYYAGNVLFREVVRYLASDAVLRDDLVALDELHTMTCRYSISCCSSIINMYSCSRTLQAIRDAYDEHQALGYSQADPAVLAEVDRRIAATYQPGRGLFGSITQPQGSLPQRLDSYYIHGGVWGRLEELAFYDQQAAQQPATHQQLRHEFIELERFNYTTLSWEQH